MKGWTVKTQATKKCGKGIAARQYYLHNKNDKSHGKTESLTRVWGNSQTMAGVVYNAEMAAAKVKAQGKGGRPTESYAMEFTLDLPKGRRPTHEQWQQIAKQMIIDVSKKLGIPPKQLSDQTYAVVHRQDQTPEYDARGRKVGTGDHMHVIIGKFTPDGVCLRDLQRKTMTHVVKESFNNSTMKMGFDWTQYRDYELQAQEHANKRTVPTWRVKSARELETITARQAALDAQAQSLIERAAELEILGSEIEEKIKEARDIERLKSNFANQAEKWVEAFKIEDAKQMNRQFNRMNKTIDELGAFTMRDEDLSAINKLSEQINSRSTQQLTQIKPKSSSTFRAR
jgi:uncharacterized protein YfcZ (UPF0381/DUF406 family)